MADQLIPEETPQNMEAVNYTPVDVNYPHEVGQKKVVPKKFPAKLIAAGVVMLILGFGGALVLRQVMQGGKNTTKQSPSFVSPVPTVTAASNIYRADEHGVSFSYPKGWVYKMETDGSIVFSPPDTDSPAESITVSLFQRSYGEAVAQLSEVYKGGASEDIAIADMLGVHMAGKVEGQSGGAFVLSGEKDKAIIIGYAQISDTQNYSAALEMVQSIKRE